MNNDFLKNMIDAQKNMINSWQDSYKNMMNISDNPYSKAMSDFFDMQKKYLELLSSNQTDSISNLFGTYFKNPAFDAKTFEYFVDMQKNYIDQMSKFMQENSNFSNFQAFPFMDMSKWSDTQTSINEYFDKLRSYYNPLQMGKAFTPAMKDLFEKMMQANTYYLNMYKFWKELEELNISPAYEEFKKYTSTLAEKYDVMFKDMVIPMLPQEFQTFAKDPLDLLKSYINTGTNFYAPWTSNAKQLRDLFVEGVLTDKAKLGQFFELWREQFDKTFGAILLSPSMGINKELIEQQSKTFDTFVDMIMLSTDFTSRIFAVQNEHLDDMIQKYLEMSEKGVQPKSFNEFYTFWSNELEGILDSYFATPEYSKLLGQLSTTAMDYKIEMQKLIEKYLADTPIVTRTEINSLYKTIYDLKKEIKSMRKEQNKSNDEN